MNEFMKRIIDMYIIYFNSGCMEMVVGISLIYMICSKADQKKKYMLILPVLLAFAVIVCPVTAWIICQIIGEDVYWRSFWTIPIVAVGAYAGTQIITGIKGKGKKLLVILLCLFLLVENGSFTFRDDFFVKAENEYKVPKQLVEIADVINKHAKLNQVKKKKIIAPIWVSTYLRIYDASFIQAYGRNRLTLEEYGSKLFNEINSENPNMKWIAKRIKKKHYRYAVVVREYDDRAAMEKKGLSMIYQSKHFDVYFNEKYSIEKNNS